MPSPIQHLDIHPSYGRRLERKRGWKALAYKILPLHTLLPLRDELFLAWVRLKTRGAPRRFRDARNLLVNVGAGGRGHAGWINVDVHPAPGVTLIYDCRKYLPFPDGSVRGIFTEHFLEHLDYTEEVPYFMAECHRALQPGGVLRIVVPDAGRYLHAYATEGWNELGRIRPLEADGTDSYLHCRYNTRMELINVLFRHGRHHKWAYDYETLEFLLRRNAFSAVAQSEFGRSALPELCIDLPLRASESLYVEATK